MSETELRWYGRLRGHPPAPQQADYDDTTAVSTNIKPRGDKVVLQIDADEKLTSGGIWIDPAVIERDDVLTGTVLAAGPDAAVTQGERVLIRKECAFAVLTEAGGPEVILAGSEQLEGVLEP